MWCVVLAGGSVSAEDRPDESGGLATSLSMATGGSVATVTVATSSAVAGATSIGGMSGVAAGGGGTAVASALGSGTPSTPVNLPAVLQDRPHSGRGRVPPPVPPRSPRGGTYQATSTSSSFSLARGGVASLSLPPSPRFAGGSPRFSHLCSPSIGMTGYNIWHADSMCRLDKECMVPMMHVQPSERQHPVWQLPTEDVLALSPIHSGNATPYDTPQKRALRRTNAEAAIHAVREVWEAIKTASRPGTPTSASSHHLSDDEITNPPSQCSHSQSCTPSCLTAQHYVDQSKHEFVLPDTHITSTGNSPSSHSLVQQTSPCLARTSPKHNCSKYPYQAVEQVASLCSPHARKQKITQTFSPSPLLSERGLTETDLPKSPGSIKGAIPKSPVPQVNHFTSKESSKESVAWGRKCWIDTQEFVPYDETRLLPENMKPQSRKSFAGTETFRMQEANPKRKSMVDKPSAGDEAYIEHTLARYLGRSRSPPFKDLHSHLTHGNSYSPPHYMGSFSPAPYSRSRTPSPLGRPLVTQVGTLSDADLCRNSPLAEVQSSSPYMSSPTLVKDLHRLQGNQPDDHHSPCPDLQRTFFSEV